MAPAVVLTAGACFATRGDVRILQGDIARLQVAAAQSAAADSARALQLRRIIQTLNNLSDSLRASSATLQRFQGDVSMSIHGVEQQLLTIQELTGQSRKQVDALRVEVGDDAPAVLRHRHGAEAGEVLHERRPRRVRHPMLK